METTRGPSGGYGDNVRMMGMTGTMWGQHGDNGDDVRMTGTTCGDHRPWRPQTMETTWGPSGGYGDNMRMTGMMGTMWG